MESAGHAPARIRHDTAARSANRSRTSDSRRRVDELSRAYTGTARMSPGANTTLHVAAALLVFAMTALRMRTAGATEPDYREALVGVRVNSLPCDAAALIVFDVHGSLWLAAEDLRSWGIADAPLAAATS